MQDQQPPLLSQPRQPGLGRSSKKNLEKLPEIPDKIYFTIGEASNLCLVKPHVLRYWEQEFPQLRPNKRRGNRRYYQQSEIMLIRRIKSLLYEHGFTIDGARIKLRSGDKINHPPDVSQTDPTKFIQSIVDQLTIILEGLERN